MTARPTLLRQARAVATRDLLRERRRGEVLWVTLPFGAIALLLVPLAIGIDTPTLHRVGPGLYWVVVLLFGSLVVVRSTAADDTATRALALRLGVDPAAAFAGKAAASTLLIVGFEVVVGFVALFLYDLRAESWPLVALAMVLVGIGLGLLGTIAGSITAGAGGAYLVPFLVGPLAVPLLVGATQVTEAGLGGSEGILAWMLLLLLVDVVLAVAGVISARPLQETV